MIQALRRFAGHVGRSLFRWQSDGDGLIVLNQRRVFILPTATGLLFALTLIVMLLGAINYTLALGHALVFLLAGLGLTGMVHTFRNLAWLRLSPGRAEPVFAGELAHFPLHLENDRPRPRLALEFGFSRQPVARCDLPANDRLTLSIPLAAEQRGWLMLPRLRLATCYPLGLFVAWSYPAPAMRCLVYPRPLTLPLPPASLATTAGARTGEGGQEDFAGLRARQPADSPRHVAWKASAREPDAPLLVKVFGGGAQTELWLEEQALPGTFDFEHRLSALTGWVLAADGAGLRYGLRLGEIEILPDAGPAHRQRCLEHLALARS